jgi:hypothetical protein
MYDRGEQPTAWYVLCSVCTFTQALGIRKSSEKGNVLPQCDITKKAPKSNPTQTDTQIILQVQKKVDGRSTANK